MSDLILREELKRRMYHEAFETDSDLQKWDSGCWIRYKLFENVIDTIPSAEIKEYVKDGTLTIQARTIKEAKSIDKIVVYADGYKQEYYMPLPSAEKVGEWIDVNGDGSLWACSLCGDGHCFKNYYCPNCGARMERSK